MTVPITGRGPEVLSVYAVFTCLTTITTALRIYCRVFLVKKFAWDDWTAVVGWVSHSMMSSGPGSDMS